MSKQKQFNKTWETSGSLPGVSPDRRGALVTEAPQFEEFYRNAKQIAAVKCDIAKMDLASWAIIIFHLNYN